MPRSRRRWPSGGRGRRRRWPRPRRTTHRPAANMAERTIPPGSTIGILGGGQLGRMTALAAARLGYKCLTYSPEIDAITAQVAGHVQGPYEDDELLGRF